jgi:hypothetical protein
LTVELDYETTPIGWQGISVRVPKDWTLGGVGGDHRSGYLRVDDEKMPRLQVKWSQGHTNLERKREEYAKRLTVGKRKRPTGLTVDLEAKVISHRAKPKKELATFAWRGPQCGMGVLWNCEVCRRALIAQVSWQQPERLHEVARQVLGSLEDHAIGGWQLWGVDGFAFLAPEGYELGKWKRMTRFLELTLTTRKQATLRAVRWGMVPLVLSGRTLMEWYQDEHQRRRDVRWQGQEMEVKGHQAVAAWGERRRLAGRLRKAWARLLRRRPVVNFAACAWHCPESNRLYLVETVYGEGQEVLKGVVDSIICHQEE